MGQICLFAPKKILLRNVMYYASLLSLCGALKVVQSFKENSYNKFRNMFWTKNLPEIDHFSTDKIIFLVCNGRKFFSCLYWAYQWILGCIGLAESCFLNKIPTISIWTSDNQHNLARASEASSTLNQSDELFECVWPFCRTRT